MKIVSKKIFLVLILAMIISGIYPSNILAASKNYVKSLSVSKKTLNISVGKTKSLSYKVKVKGKASRKITVKSSNTNVKVTVKKSKISIFAKKTGSSKITISTKGKNKKGKKIKKTVKIKITKGKNPVATPSKSRVEVTKSEWISTVMKTTGYDVQKGIFNYDENGNIIYSFTDIADDANADIIETAVKYGIIPNSGGKFNPNNAASREFLAVTSVRAIGFAAEDLEINYYDKSDLKYKTEDAVAIQLKLLKLSDNNFLPTKAITKTEKQNADKILSDIIKSRDIDENHKDIIEYSEDVVNEKEVNNYTVSEQNGIYTVTVSTGTSLGEVEEGDKIVLPATNSYPDGIALIVISSTVSSDGKSRIVRGSVPDEVTEFVEKIDIEGMAEADSNGATAVDGVATLEVTKDDNGDNTRQNISNNKLKNASIDGEINLKDKTKYTFTIKEIETTISFYLSELKYRVDFNKKGVNEIYIGLPNVISMDTDYKVSKNFSKKIGDVPINIGAGFSANIEVYLEASISGEISMNLKLSNNIGMQFYNGEFYVVKSCEPSFDMMVDADVDAGAKLQLGLYWMQGIKKVFGKEDSRPIYNVYTKWGIHGDATIHIRNDQYTSYENLTCIDLGYYLYGKVGVGDGSFLGDKFKLTKIWVIFDDENSPLKGEWHIENGKMVDLCTYNLTTNTILKNYAKQFNYSCYDTKTYDVYASYNADESCINTINSIPIIPFTYDIDDYDGDGVVELLIVNTGSYKIDYDSYSDTFKALYLEMYEVEDGSIVKKAVSDYKVDDKYLSFYISPHDGNNEGSTIIYKYQVNDTPIIALEQHSLAYIFADGIGVTFRACKYNGHNFESVGDSWFAGSDFDEDSLKDIEIEYKNMGIEANAEQIINGKKKIYDYVNNPIFLGKSTTSMTVDWTITETLYNNPSLQYKISYVNFSIN